MDNEEAPITPSPSLPQHLSNTHLQTFPNAQEGDIIIPGNLCEEGNALDHGTTTDIKVETEAPGTTGPAEEREVLDMATEGLGMDVADGNKGNQIVHEDIVALGIDEAENVNERVEEEEDDDNADVAYDDNADQADAEIRDDEEAPNEEQKVASADGDNDSDGVGDDMTHDTDTAALMEEEEEQGEGQEEADADGGGAMAHDIEEEEEQGGGGEEGGGDGSDGMEEDSEVREEQSASVSGGKRKHGAAKNSKTSGRVASKKKMEEDVCFICFDGGDLVLCDRR